MGCLLAWIPRTIIFLFFNSRDENAIQKDDAINIQDITAKERAFRLVVRKRVSEPVYAFAGFKKINKAGENGRTTGINDRRTPRGVPAHTGARTFSKEEKEKFPISFELPRAGK